MMRNRLNTILCLTVGILMSAVRLYALDVKDFTYSHLGKTEGVSSHRIFSICQSATKALWWSSMTGVERYNGFMVMKYALDDHVPFANLGGRVIRLQVDSAAIYAYDNWGKIFRFNPYRNGFDNVTNVSDMLGHDVALNDLLVDGETLYLAMHDGAYMLKGGKLTQLMRGPYVNRFVTVRGRILCCTRDGVTDMHGRRLLPYNTECGYYDEMSERLWLGGYENGLHLITMDDSNCVADDQFVPFSSDAPAHSPIRSICPYDDHTMLLGIDGAGVYQTRRDGHGPCSVLFDDSEQTGCVLHGNGVYAVVVDSWGNIVVGTYSGGIDIARPIGSTVAVYKHEAGNRQSLGGGHVNMVMPLSPGRLMFGTDNGISLLDTEIGHWQHHCQGTVVLSAETQTDGNILVATYGKGLLAIDGQGNTNKVYTKANSPLTDDHVFATMIDKDGGLWVGTLNGDLLYKNPLTAEYQYYPVHDVQTITQMTSGQIAVGTAFGLKLITPGSREVKELNYAPSGITDVNPFVTHLLASGMELWIGTDGGGVYIYHLAKHESRQITTADGLPSNYVRSLAQSRDGRIWIATNEGLAFMSSDSPNKAVNVNYCYELNQDFSRGAVCNLSNGDMIFGTAEGAVVMHPENVQPLNYTASLALLGVNCDTGQEALQTREVFELLQQGKLHLTYAQRTFTLRYESINMRNHFDIAYRYRMDNGEWSQPTINQYIRFVSMEPGRHQLMLQCVSRTSGTVIDTKELTISIGQPWWNSWWMWCVYVTLIILTFYAAWRVYKLQEKYMRLTIDYLQLFNEKPTWAVSHQHAQENACAEPEETEETAASPVAIPQGDGTDSGKEFVDKATAIILEHLSDSEFGIDRLCREMAMSRTLFYVKLKSYTGKSPQDFIRVIRLERAATMLRGGRSVTDAAAQAGFENPKYFSTVFKKYFGVSPSKYNQ